MLKGTQKKIIVMQGSTSSMFESAYFILKKEAEQSRFGEKDMIDEANRIIMENMLDPSVRLSASRRKKMFFMFAFGLGFALSAAIFLLLMICF